MCKFEITCREVKCQITGGKKNFHLPLLILYFLSNAPK